MDNIGGNTLASYGFVLMNYRGLLNMPSRLGDVFYNWGDRIDALVHEDEILFNEKEIRCEVYFDGGRYGKSLDDTLEELYSIVHTTLETDFGDYTVSLKEAVSVRRYEENRATLTLVFTDVKPFVSGALGAAIGGGITIDGYGLLKHFKIIPNKIQFIDDVPSLTQSDETSYIQKSGYVDTREWRRIKIGCTIDYKGQSEFKLDQLKYLLSTSGLKKLVYNGKSYDCFCSSGFSVTKRRSLITFNLILECRLDASSIQVLGNGLIIPYANENPKPSNHTDFGLTDFNTGYEVRQYTIKNTGNKNLSISSVSLGTGTNFVKTSSPSSTIIPGGQATFNIAFNPSAAGDFSDTISIVSNDPNYSPYTFEIAGTGFDSTLSPDPDIFGNGVQIISGDTTPDVGDNTDFGSITKGLTIEKTFVIKNNGNAPLDNFIVTLTNAIGFSISKQPTKPIPVSGESDFKIEFNPNEVDNYDTVVNLLQGKPFVSIYNFKIKGIGIDRIYDRRISVEFNENVIDNNDPATLLIGNDYGDVKENSESKTKPIRVDSIGSDALSIGFPVISGDSDFSWAQSPYNPSYPNSVFYRAIFTPTSLGAKTAVLSIPSNDNNGDNPFLINLKGVGVLQDIPEARLKGLNEKYIDAGDITPSALDGTDFENNIGDRIFILENIGNSDLIIQGVSQSISENLFLTKINGIDLVSVSFPLTIVSGGSLNFEIKLAPINSGDFDNTITIETNDPNLVDGDFIFKVSASVVVGTLKVQGNNIDIANLDVRPEVLDGTLDDDANLLGINSQAFKILNQGSGIVEVKNIRLLFGNVFNVLNIYKKSLSSNSDTDFSIQSTTQLEPKNYKACVLIESNVGEHLFYVETLPDKSLMKINNGVDVLVSGDLTGFGQVNKTDNREIIFKVTNRGIKVLTLNSITSDSPLFVVNSAIDVILPNQYAFFSVNFSPATDGIKNGKITINSTDEINQLFEINVTGQGVTHSFELTGNEESIPDDNTPNSTDGTSFGVGASSNSFELENLTITPLEIERIEVVQSGNDFSSTTELPITIGENESLEIQIDFSPSDGAAKYAEIIIMFKGVISPKSFFVDGNI